MIPHFSKRVMMDSHGLVDPLVPRCLVGNIAEQHLQARSRCEALALAILGVDWFLLEQRAQLIHESIGPQQ